jgi:hypothetical protein
LSPLRVLVTSRNPRRHAVELLASPADEDGVQALHLVVGALRLTLDLNRRDRLALCGILGTGARTGPRYLVAADCYSPPVAGGALDELHEKGLTAETLRLRVL